MPFISALASSLDVLAIVAAVLGFGLWMGSLMLASRWLVVQDPHYDYPSVSRRVVRGPLFIQRYMRRRRHGQGMPNLAIPYYLGIAVMLLGIAAFVLYATGTLV